MTDLVSIIIPIYKVEEFLEECVNSVLNQTYTNLEIILVDDGSPDSCPSICDNFEKKENRIKVIHKQNGGLSSARNVGIDLATGQWIMFFDSDDVLHPSTIERLLNGVKTNQNCKVAACTYQKFDKNYLFENYSNPSYQIMTYDEYVHVPLNIIACAKLYKTELFKTIRFPLGKLHEDEFTTWKVLVQSEKILYLPEPLYFYRQRVGSIMAKKTQKNFDNALEALFERMEYFKNNGNVYQYLFACNNIVDIYYLIKNNLYGYTPDRKQLFKLKASINSFSVSNASYSYKIKFFCKLNFPQLLFFISKFKL